MDMITRIVASEVIVHAREGYVDQPAFGPSIFDKPSKWMLEVHTSEGLVGFGETARVTSRGDVEQSIHEVLGKPLTDFPWQATFKPDLRGSDMFGHENAPVPHRIHERTFGLSKGKSALQVALHDLWAKSFGIPLHELLGGAHRDWVPTSWWMGRTEPEHAKRQMEVGLQQGFTGVKIKAAAEDDVPGVVAAIKEVAGEKASVGIDPNLRFYRLAEAVYIARRLEAFENVLLEDPFPFDAEEWRLFRQKTSVPIALGNGGQLHLAAARHSCDYVNLGGNAWQFLADAHLAARFGMLCWHSSGLELGVLDAYRLHLSAAARNCVLPGDAIGHRIRSDDLIEETLEVKDGAIRVPSGPGLGVTLDQAAVEKHLCTRFELTA